MKLGDISDLELKQKAKPDMLTITNKMLKVNGFATLPKDVGMKGSKLQ